MERPSERLIAVLQAVVDRVGTLDGPEDLEAAEACVAAGLLDEEDGQFILTPRGAEAVRLTQGEPTSQALERERRPPTSTAGDGPRGT